METGGDLVETDSWRAHPQLGSEGGLLGGRGLRSSLDMAVERCILGQQEWEALNDDEQGSCL